MSVPIPVIPFNPEAELEKEMERKKGKLGLGDMLNSQDASTGNTMFHDLLQGAGTASGKAKDFLQNKFAPAVGNFLWGETPEVPGDFYTDFVRHPETGEWVHPGVVERWNRDQDLKFKSPMF